MLRVDPLIVERRWKPIDLEGIWAPCPGFLVCTGPSVNNHPVERLRERGIVSLAVNGVAAWVPVKAWSFSDKQTKFHHALFFDPAIMTFAPTGKMHEKLHRKIMVKTGKGFQRTEVNLYDCPNTYGFSRTTKFVPDTFFTDPQAHWGPGKHQPKDVPGVGTLCGMLLGIRLLHYLGVRRMYLLGVDYDKSGGIYAFPSSKSGRKGFGGERKMLELLLPVFARHGVELWNCNRESKCGLFPHRSFDDAMDDCRGSIPGEPLDTWDWYDKNLANEQVKRNPVFVPRHFEEAVK